MVEPDLIIDLKSSSTDVLIIKGLGLLFLDLHVLICVVP